MELFSILLVFDFSRFWFALKVSELVLIELFTAARLELLLGRWHEASMVLPMDWNACLSSFRFSIQVFRFYFWNEARITRDVLCTDVLCWTAEPVFSPQRVISVLQCFVDFILWWRIWVKWPCCKLRFSLSNFNVIIWWLIPSLGDDPVDISFSAAINVFSPRDKPSVARQILLVVWTLLRHFVSVTIIN